MFGLFYGVHYLYHDKNLLKFDAIHQKVVLWRILARRNGILAFGCKLSWQYCRVVFVFYQVVELLFSVDIETELAHFLGHEEGAPLISHDKVGWIFLVFACAGSAAIWEFARAILEISLTQVNNISLPRAHPLSRMHRTRMRRQENSLSELSSEAQGASAPVET